MTADDGHRALPWDRPWFAANEVLAFVLELVAIGALAWWGSTAQEGAAASAALGIGTPAAAVALWGLFAAPRAHFSLPLPGVLAVKALVLGGGVRDGAPRGGVGPGRGHGREHGLRGVLQAPCRAVAAPGDIRTTRSPPDPTHRRAKRGERRRAVRGVVPPDPATPPRQIRPCASMASATISKPAMFAPTT